MTIEQQVLEKLRDSPPEKQKEVLDFVDFLKEKNGPTPPSRACAGFGRISTYTLRKRISPRLDARCGTTFRVT